MREEVKQEPHPMGFNFTAGEVAGEVRQDGQFWAQERPVERGGEQG